MKGIIIVFLLYIVSSCSDNDSIIIKGCVRSNVDDLPIRDIVVYFPSNSEDYSFRNVLLATDIKTNEKGLFYIRENRQDIKEYLFYLIYHDSIIKEVNLKDNKNMNSFLFPKKMFVIDLIFQKAVGDNVEDIDLILLKFKYYSNYYEIERTVASEFDVIHLIGLTKMKVE